MAGAFAALLTPSPVDVYDKPRCGLTGADRVHIDSGDERSGPETAVERSLCVSNLVAGFLASPTWISAMKVKNSLKSLRGRHRDNRLVRRKGRVYIINKTNPRFKARQG